MKPKTLKVLGPIILAGIILAEIAIYTLERLKTKQLCSKI